MMGADIVVIGNEMAADGVRRVHLICNTEIDPAQWTRAGKARIPATAEMKHYLDELRMYHLEAAWRVREPMTFDFRPYGGQQRQVVVWALDAGQRISEAALEAALAFFEAFDAWPGAAWVKKWPRGLKEEEAYIPIDESHGMDLFAVDWAIDRAVVVGGGFTLDRRGT
jgi:hypothetical protein